MAGHSKWANIKHRKAREDARRNKVFTKMARLITVAAREGGPDPETNFRLRLAIDKARSVNVPNDNIERAIKRGVGEQGGDQFEELVYEGYGPNGVAILLQAMTDNRNRTAADMRHLFSKHGGNLGESGCVAWMFEKVGEIRIAKDSMDEDELMMAALEAGADDVDTDGDDEHYIITTSPDTYSEVRDALESQGVHVVSAEVTMIPKNTVSVDGPAAEKVISLLEALEDHDDVQDVFANFETSEESLTAAH